MWKLYADDYLIFAETLPEYKIFDSNLSLELNKTGALSFTIYPNHPNFDKLKKLKSIITLYMDSEIYFRGRILNDEIGFYNQRIITCEGELAFLLDSIQRPFSFPVQDTDPATPEDYLRFLVNRHNAQVSADHQFTLGEVTVTDPNDYISRSDTEYENTWDLINSGLINTLGGYLWVRHENGVNYLDYLADFDVLGNQPIEFGKNLLDVVRSRKGEDICTAIVPVGATIEPEEEGEESTTVTISELPDEETSDICKSEDFVYSKAAENLYGHRITKMVKWEDVTSPSNLLTKAKAKLQNSILQEETTEFSAADLSAAGYDFNSFQLGTYIRSKSNPHDIDGMFLVTKLNINIQNPASNTVSVGSTVYSFTEQNKREQDTIRKEVQTNVEKNNSKIVRELELRMDSTIEQTSESIMSRVEESYYTKGETDQKVSGVSTELEQTANAFEFRFSNLQTNLNEVEDGANARFSEIKSYIRLENGNIILGLDDASFKQIQSATKNSFLDGAVEVAYMSNKKMYITDGEFTNSLQLGKFAWLPRSNGNLSFKKVVD